MLEDMLRKVYRDTKWKELDEKEKEMTSADDIPFPGGQFLSSSKNSLFKNLFLDFSWMQQINENKNNWQEKATAAAEKVEEKAAE